MKVTEAFTLGAGHGLDQDASVSGLIVVSEAVTYLCPSKVEHQPAILVIAPWLVRELLDEVPISVGSMHLFGGPATVTGRLVSSGLELLPLAFYQVSNVELFVDGCHVKLRA